MNAFSRLILLLLSASLSAGGRPAALADAPAAAPEAPARDNAAADADVAPATRPAEDGEAGPTDAAKEVSIDELPWEVRPYRVLVSLSVADRAVMNEQFLQRTFEVLLRAADAAAPAAKADGMALPRFAVADSVVHDEGGEHPRVTIRLRAQDGGRVYEVTSTDGMQTFVA